MQAGTRMISLGMRTELAKRNFVFQACKLGNVLIGKLMNECRPNSNGIMIPGSANCSDLSAPISAIKELNWIQLIN